MILIIENMTYHERMLLLNVLQQTHKVADLDNQCRVLDKVVDLYGDETEVWVKEEKE